MAENSNGSVVAAIAGSACITVVKFLAAAFSGSAGLMAEGIHSTLDTANSALMYLGQRRSQKPADEDHPFGYGMELYFWTLVVALLMFAIGGMATIAEGVYRILQPEELEGVGWNYAALGVSALFNGYTWFVAFREFRAGQGKRTFRQSLQKAKDPTTLTVLFEDSASLIGLLIAFVGVLLSSLLQNPLYDGCASILIGLLMALVAVGLIYQSKQLLVGESINDELKQHIRTLVETEEGIVEVQAMRTMHLSPQAVLAALVVRFQEDLSAQQVSAAIDRLCGALQEKYPEIKYVSIQPTAEAAHEPEVNEAMQAVS